MPFALCCFLLVSCSNQEVSGSDDGFSGIDSNEINNAQKLSAQNIFNSVPSPQEFTEIISRIHLEYNGSLLNNPDNYTKYSTDDFKALNLGVYGTDLTYTSVFEQTQESMVFLKRVNQACKSLGISGVFDERTFDRIEANRQNKDSLLKIISNSFWNADKFLKENKRGSTSSLMVAGGWVEGVYLALRAVKMSKDHEIAKRIIEQKNTLHEVIYLLENVKIEPQAMFILEQLRGLANTFDKAPPVASGEKEEYNKEVDSFITSLDDQVTDLRNKITLQAAA